MQRRSWHTAGAVVAGLALCGSPAPAAQSTGTPPQADPGLRAPALAPAVRDVAAARALVAPDAVPGQYVVTFAAQLDAAARAEALRDIDAVVVARIARLDATVVRLGGSAELNAARARADKRFATVEPDALYRTTGVPNDPGYAQQYAFTRIGAPAAWDVTRGSAATVIAIVDTGVQTSHPDLDAKIVPGVDYVDGDAAPEDGNGHGTHVAGSAAAETGNGTGGAGTCPDCSIMPVRVLDDSGSGSLSAVAQGIVFAVDNGAKVVNLSLSGPGSPTLQNAVDYAAGKGVFVSCAAGNDGTDITASAYPAAYANCFAVASTTSSDAKAASSNYGSWVEAAAPGSGIYSTWRNSGYATTGGTSMAAPHVAGLAGLLANQGFGRVAAQDRICATADRITGTGTQWSCGRINAAAALAGTTTPPPPPPPPPPPAPPRDVVANGGFEDGPSPWSQTSAGGYALVDGTRPRSGAAGGWLGGYNAANDSLSQAVTLPAAGATLRFWWQMSTRETGAKPYDVMRVRILSPSGAVLGTVGTWSNVATAGVWQEASIGLGGLGGRDVIVEFQATTDNSLSTSFFVDDVTLIG